MSENYPAVYKVVPDMEIEDNESNYNDTSKYLSDHGVFLGFDMGGPQELYLIQGKVILHKLIVVTEQSKKVEP